VAICNFSAANAEVDHGVLQEVDLQLTCSLFYQVDHLFHQMIYFKSQCFKDCSYRKRSRTILRSLGVVNQELK
jgi:hypothetical protein